MKTTLDIPREKMERLIESGNFSSKKEAVNTAIDAYLRERRIAELLEAAGTMDDFMSSENLQEIRRDD